MILHIILKQYVIKLKLIKQVAVNIMRKYIYGFR